jgi:hypothetical protein
MNVFRARWQAKAVGGTGRPGETAQIETAQGFFDL